MISLLSVSPPHSEMAMDGRSDMCSQKLSTPLSPPELTDCGERLALCRPESGMFFTGAPLSLNRWRHACQRAGGS